MNILSEVRLFTTQNSFVKVHHITKKFISRTRISLKGDRKKSVQIGWLTSNKVGGQ